MKLKSELELHRVCGETVVIATGEKSLAFNKMISLNESAACIWEAVAGADFTLADMVRVLLDAYDVDDATAEKDCSLLLENWQKAGLLEN